MLSDHPITTGRDLEERVNKVGVWGGQSITGPSGSTILFRLSPTAYNSGDRAELETKNYRRPNVWGNAQVIAFTLGKGRVVMTTDCSMWTAQLINNYGEYGMARKDLDNRQFGLNVMHWLSHILN